MAPHDYSKTSFSYIERDTGREYWVEVPEQPEDLEVEIAEEATGDEFAPTLATDSGGPVDTVTLMTAGESKWVEFKASACFDRESGNRNKDLEFAVAKTIVGFANAHGGTLFIGVNDVGEAVGLKDDYRLANQKRQDPDLTVTFMDVVGNDVCRIDVKPASSPIFMRGQKADGDFYVRLNNSTRLLTTADALEYVRSHWR